MNSVSKAIPQTISRRLYLNYWLDTEDTDFDYGPNPDQLMRDALRVFVQDEAGAWNLLVTNNSQQDSSIARPMNSTSDQAKPSQTV